MKYLSLIIIVAIFVFSTFIVNVNAAGFSSFMYLFPKEQVLATHEMPLTDRYPNPNVNTAFKDNIFLTLLYLSGKVTNPSQINWHEIDTPFHYELTVAPGDVFAFHDMVLPQYQNRHIVTTNAHFAASEGFVSDGYLYGDGVCHLASLLNWAARDAGLAVNAPINHDFAVIPDIPKEYGTAIYTAQGETEASALQNLYIENNFTSPVKFVFIYQGDNLTVKVDKVLF